MDFSFYDISQCMINNRMIASSQSSVSVAWFTDDSTTGDGDVLSLLADFKKESEARGRLPHPFVCCGIYSN